MGNTGASVGGSAATPGTGAISLTTLNGNIGNSGTTVTCLNAFCGTPGGGTNSTGGGTPTLTRCPGGTQFAYAPTGGGAGGTSNSAASNISGQAGGKMAVTGAQAAGAITTNAGNGTAATTFSPGGGGGGGGVSSSAITTAGNGIVGGGGGGERRGAAVHGLEVTKRARAPAPTPAPAPGLGVACARTMAAVRTIQDQAQHCLSDCQDVSSSPLLPRCRRRVRIRGRARERRVARAFSLIVLRWTRMRRAR